jgi:hypothetical protein
MQNGKENNENVSWKATGVDEGRCDRAKTTFATQEPCNSDFATDETIARSHSAKSALTQSACRTSSIAASVGIHVKLASAKRAPQIASIRRTVCCGNILARAGEVTE